MAVTSKTLVTSVADEPIERSMVGISRGVLTLAIWLLNEILTASSTIAMIPVSSRTTVCRGSGLVGIPSTAETVPSTDITVHPSAQYHVPSVIMCAGISNSNKAAGYIYKDGICYIYGPGTGNYSPSVQFGAANLPPISSLEEVAQSKPTYAYAQYLSYYSSYAVDGIIQNTGNMYHSANDHFPWWIVDLREMRAVHQIQIFTRQDCCYDRLHSLEVRIGSTLRTDGNFSSYILMATYQGPYSLNEGHVICSHFTGVDGRYVAIYKNSNILEALQLSEVKVYAKKL